MSALSPGRIRELSAGERIELIERLWESFAELPDSLPVTDEQRLELRRRLAEHQANPDDAVPWSEVLEKLDRE